MNYCMHLEVEKGVCTYCFKYVATEFTSKTYSTAHELISNNKCTFIQDIEKLNFSSEVIKNVKKKYKDSDIGTHRSNKKNYAEFGFIYGTMCSMGQYKIPEDVAVECSVNPKKMAEAYKLVYDCLETNYYIHPLDILQEYYDKTQLKDIVSYEKVLKNMGEKILFTEAGKILCKREKPQTICIALIQYYAWIESNNSNSIPKSALHSKSSTTIKNVYDKIHLIYCNFFS